MSPVRSSLVHRLHARLYFWRGLVHRHYGNLSGERREYQWAVGDFSRAIELKPDDVAAHYRRGVLRWKRGANLKTGSGPFMISRG
ncbi:MAG TPA: hypothetical protein VFF59_10650 [Anaerolineae bacterium]|nr:hypothetical protein [Anaerolineae bacterium]